jgi:hypothetical protein
VDASINVGFVGKAQGAGLTTTEEGETAAVCFRWISSESVEQARRTAGWLSAERSVHFFK